MAKNFKKTAIKTEKKFKKSDFSVIARSKATKQSRKRECGTLDCFATLAMTGRIDCHVAPFGLFVMMLVKRLPHQVRQ